MVAALDPQPRILQPDTALLVLMHDLVAVALGHAKGLQHRAVRRVEHG
jgi:hypothetical protein